MVLEARLIEQIALSRWNAGFPPVHTHRKNGMGCRDKNPSPFPNQRYNASSAKEDRWQCTFTIILHSDKKKSKIICWDKLLKLLLAALLINYGTCFPVISIVSLSRIGKIWKIRSLNTKKLCGKIIFFASIHFFEKL